MMTLYMICAANSATEPARDNTRACSQLGGAVWRKESAGGRFQVVDGRGMPVFGLVASAVTVIIVQARIDRRKS